MKFSQDLILPIGIAVSSFIFSIFILGFVSSQVFFNPRIAELGLFEAWSIWDGPHYLDIADNWYVPGGDDANWIVFLPLYPLLVRMLALITPLGILYSGFFVSFICSILASVFLYKLARLDETKKTSVFSIIALFLFPTSFFLFLPYPESLFLLLILLTFYFARKGNFLTASFFAMLATGTKIAGLALIPVIFVELILHHIKFKRPAKLLNFFVILNLPILGFLFYLLVNYQTFGDIFYFQRAQSQNWNTNFSPVIAGVRQTLSFINDQDFDTRIYLGYGQILAFGLSVITAIYAYFKLRKSYFVFSLAFLGIYSSMSFWLSFPRYLLCLFPLYIMLGRFLNNRMFLALWVTVCLIFLFVFGTIAVEHGPVL